VIIQASINDYKQDSQAQRQKCATSANDTKDANAALESANEHIAALNADIDARNSDVEQQPIFNQLRQELDSMTNQMQKERQGRLVALDEWERTSKRLHLTQVRSKEEHATAEQEMTDANQRLEHAERTLEWQKQQMNKSVAESKKLMEKLEQRDEGLYVYTHTQLTHTGMCSLSLTHMLCFIEFTENLELKVKIGSTQSEMTSAATLQKMKFQIVLENTQRENETLSTKLNVAQKEMHSMENALRRFDESYTFSSIVIRSQFFINHLHIVQ
jgi:chromosome segregation ATPase